MGDAAWDEDPEAEALRKAEAPLYRDPFGASGPCRRIWLLPEETRERVRRSCPRCGRPGDAASWVEAGEGAGEAAGPCILEGVDLDLEALEEELASRERQSKKEDPSQKEDS